MEQRFALLLQAQAISQKSHDHCLHALRLIDDELGLSHDNEQYQMALTHLSRAADRIWQGEEIQEGLDEDILNEIYDDPESESVLDLHRKTLNIMGLSNVSNNEEGFLIANAYALFQLSKSHEM